MPVVGQIVSHRETERQFIWQISVVTECRLCLKDKSTILAI